LNVRSRKTFLLSYDYPPKRGGISTYAEELSRAFHAQGHANLLVIAPGTTRDEEIPTKRITLPFGAFLSPLIFAWHLSLARKENPDHNVFCTNWYPVGLAAWMVQSLSRKKNPYFVAVHGAEIMEKNGILGWIKKQLRRRVLAAAAGTFPVSRFTAGRLMLDLGENFPGKISVLSNGVNPGKFFPIPESLSRTIPVVLSVCRLEEHKGIDTALRAFKLLKDQGIAFEYRVAGTGRCVNQLQSLCRELGLESQVTFLGNVPDDQLNKVYNDCDLFLLLSRQAGANIEGFGLVFLEAAACGKTAVGSDSGGIADAVIDGETGLLIPANDPERAAQAIGCLLNDPELRQRLARQARDRARGQMSWGSVANKLRNEMSFYRE
jgi:phosphatidyl-myo-inositol dimannoside synthase